MAHPVPTKFLVRQSLRYARSLLHTLKTATDSGALKEFLDIDQPAHKDPTNVTRRIDQIGQRLALQFFANEFGELIERYGEEGKPLPDDVGKSKKTILLLDPIDGTDLIARGFSNWCSALLFFYPQNPEGQKILMSLVAHGSGSIYYATPKGTSIEWPPRVKGYEGERKVKHRPTNRLRLKGDAPKLSDATICYYGQKPDHFLSVTESKSFLLTMEEIQKLTAARKAAKNPSEPVPGFRIYNLGGNPMLAKIAEGTVDAVFSLRSPAAHDLVPGAFIAVQAGACALETRGGGTLSLERYLLEPSVRSGYVIAASSQLAAEVVRALGIST